MHEVYIDGNEYRSQARFLMAVILEWNVHCKLLTKIKNASENGFGTFTLEEAELLTSLLIGLKVPFECELIAMHTLNIGTHWKCHSKLSLVLQN